MDKPNRALTVLNVGTAVLFVAAASLVFFFAPLERVMGEVQRIFYFHVAAAWVSALAFGVTLVAGLAYLRTAQRRWDVVGSASVEIGLLFTIMTLISGSIWARPIWNTWWTWDPRLTTYTILALIYVAYLLLRQSIEDPDRQARFAAVYGIFGFISVPLTFLSIRFWRTIHPVVIGNGSASASGGFDMSPAMRLVFFFSLFTFTVLYFCLLANRVRLARLADEVAQVQARLAAAQGA
jgi:heme exporter protein C